MTITDPDLGPLVIGQHHTAEPTPIHDEAWDACRRAQPEPGTPTPNQPEEDS